MPIDAVRITVRLSKEFGVAERNRLLKGLPAGVFDCYQEPGVGLTHFLCHGASSAAVAEAIRRKGLALLWVLPWRYWTSEERRAVRAFALNSTVRPIDLQVVWTAESELIIIPETCVCRSGARWVESAQVRCLDRKRKIPGLCISSDNAIIIGARERSEIESSGMNHVGFTPIRWKGAQSTIPERWILRSSVVAPIASTRSIIRKSYPSLSCSVCGRDGWESHDLSLAYSVDWLGTATGIFESWECVFLSVFPASDRPGRMAIPWLMVTADVASVFEGPLFRATFELRPVAFPEGME